MGELVAQHSLVLTTKGPASPDALKAGDKVWVVSRDGTLAPVTVRSVSSREAATVWRLLTGVGQVWLADGAYVSSAGGRLMAGDEIAKSLRRGQGVEIDVVSPGDVEFPERSGTRRVDAVRAALAHLPMSIVQVPVANGTAEVVATRLEQALVAAKVEYRRREDGRWIAFVLRDMSDEPALVSRAFGQQADALLLATSWEVSGGHIVSRVRAGDSRLLRCIVAALVGAGRQFEVKWTPKYSPVECRIRPGDFGWGAFVPVEAALPATCAILELEFARSGRPVVDMTVTTSAL